MISDMISYMIYDINITCIAILSYLISYQILHSILISNMTCHIKYDKFRFLICSP